MKKLLFLLLLIPALAWAEPVEVSYDGRKFLTWDPVTDERVVGYIIYMTHDGREYSKRIPGRETAEWQIPDYTLYSGGMYVFRIASYDIFANESLKSEPLEVYISPLAELPEDVWPEANYNMTTPQGLTMTPQEVAIGE